MTGAEPAVAEAGTLVLQAYGRPRIVQEARFAILTFQRFALRRATPWPVVVYTDQPAAFTSLGPNVATEPMDAERLRRWRGTIDFVHRVKLEMLLDAFARHAGPLLYIDSDTYFTRDPAELFARIAPDAALMHECEGRLEERKNGIFRKMDRFVRRTPLPLPGLGMARMPASTAMWNAGVLGLHPAHRDAIADALALTDAMHARYPKHVTEQLAVSYVLQTRWAVRAADDAIHHYWRHCPELEPVLAAFFAAHAGDGLDALAEAAFALRPRGTPEPPRRPWYSRLLGR